MRKNIRIGGREVAFEANGATPLVYKRIFGRDLFEDQSSETLALGEFLPRLEYTMAMQAAGCWKEANEDTFVAWLTDFDLFDIVSDQASSEVFAVYSTQNSAKIEAKKKTGPQNGE